MSEQMERIEKQAAAVGLKRMSLEDLFALAPDLFYTEKTHTIMFLGGDEPKHKVICDSTGVIFFVPGVEVRERVVCSGCGTELHSGRATISATARVIPTWEACDAWPALEEMAV